jgi:putative phosphoesterase
MTRIGLISDTHGLLRLEAHIFLQGCVHIIHAGDIGNAGILETLASIAPLTAVRGNNDHGAWTETLPVSASVQEGGVFIHVIHDLAELGIDPVAAGAQVVVSGHSHKPSVREHEGVLYINPGSAGRRRFKLPVAVAELIIENGRVQARIVELELP